MSERNPYETPEAASEPSPTRPPKEISALARGLEYAIVIVVITGLVWAVINFVI